MKDEFELPRNAKEYLKSIGSPKIHQGHIDDFAQILDAWYRYRTRYGAFAGLISPNSIEEIYIKKDSLGFLIDKK